MKRQKNLWLLVGLLFWLCFAPLSGQAAPTAKKLKSITVVSDDNYPPYIFKASKGQVQGILVDEWKLWQERTGIKVRLIAMDWNRAQQVMAAGKADVIDTIFFTEERSRRYDFTEPYAKIEVPVFFHKDLSGIVDIESLKGFTIGVKSGDACIDILKGKGIATLKEFDSYVSIVQAAANGRIKVFCIDKPPAFYYLYKMDLEKEFRHSFNLYTGEFHRAVRKGRTDLLKTVEDGFRLIQRSELAAIEKKWMGEPFLRPKYFDYVLYVFLAVGGLFIALILFNIALRRKVASKTAELQRTVGQLQDSRAHLRTLIDSFPDLVWLKNQDSVYMACNSRFERFFGVPEKDIIGKTDYDFVDENLAEFFRENDRAAIEKGASRMNEEEITFADDGHREILETIKTPVYTKEGQFLGVLGIGRDITERKIKEKIQAAKLRLIEYAADHSVKELLQRFLDEAEQLTDSKIAFYHFIEEDQEKVSFQGWSTNTISNACNAENEGVHYPLDKAGVWADCIREGRPLIHNDFAVLKHKRGFPEGHPAVIRELLVPVFRGGRIVSALGVGNKNEDYNDNDVYIIQQVAELAWEMLIRRRSEEQLQKSEARHQSIIQTVMDGFWRTDAAGRFLEVNQAYCQMSGYTEAELLQMTIRDVELKEDRKEIAGYIEKIMARGQARFESRHLCKDGAVIDVEISAQHRKDDDGQFVCFIRDITAKKKQERELSFQALLLDQIHDHVTATDLKGNIIYVNKAISKGLKRSPEDLLISSIKSYGENPQKGATQQEILESTLENGAWRGEIVNYASDGTELVLDCRTTLIRDESGNPVSLLGISTDITEQKRMAEHLRQTQKMESIGSLAGGIAHDFNNILQPIVGMSELLLEDLPPHTREYENVQEILKAGTRGADLVKQILAFSRQSAHKFIPVHIQQVLQDVLRLIRATIPSNIDIIQDIQSDCGLVMADPTQIHQVVMNIMTNASHALEFQSGKIRVSLKETVLEDKELPSTSLQPGRYAQLTIADNGHGMPPELMAKIFEPYFTTKETGKGTGLGLAVVYGIIKEHRGEITVDSEVGKGTVFNIFLSIVEEKKPDEIPAPKAEAPPTGNENILLVDDEESIARLEARLLVRLGYNVTFHTGSLEALDQFRANPFGFDMVITDMTMPKMTGDQLAREMRAIRPDIPIVICSGFNERMSDEKAMALGIKGYLMKPVLRADLVKMVRRVLDESGGRGGP